MNIPLFSCFTNSSFIWYFISYSIGHSNCKCPYTLIELKNSVNPIDEYAKGGYSILNNLSLIVLGVLSIGIKRRLTLKPLLRVFTGNVTNVCIYCIAKLQRDCRYFMQIFSDSRCEVSIHKCNLMR